MAEHPAARIRRPHGSARVLVRWMLAGLLVFSGLGHLLWGRKGYRVAVPDWAVRIARTDEDAVVVASGAVEIMLGAALVALPAERRRVGAAVAGFFVAVFPGNVHQWRTGRSAPLLRTDRARFMRLFLQPVLVAAALWSTAAHGALLSRGGAGRSSPRRGSPRPAGRGRPRRPGGTTRRPS